jgi:DNA-binding response OmpR family regulator
VAVSVPPERADRLSCQRILVVEDEAIIAMLVEDELAEAGAVVVGPAGTVDDALRLIEAAARDGGLSGAVIETDVEGVPVAPVVDRLTELGVPFLFATGTEPGRQPHRAAAPVLQKPYSSCELLAAVAALTRMDAGDPPLRA